MGSYSREYREDDDFEAIVEARAEYRREAAEERAERDYERYMTG